MVPCASPVAPWFFWLLNLLWARVVGTLRGPSQRALSHMMVLWVGKLVALATFHPRNLVFWCPQALAKRNLSTTASQVIAVVEGDPRCVQGA